MYCELHSQYLVKPATTLSPTNDRQELQIVVNRERENEGGDAGDMDLSISAGALLTEDEFGFMLAVPEDDLDFGNGR